MPDKLRRGVARPPEHLASRPIHRGYPLPYFVATVGGVPDFRVADPAKFDNCRRNSLCWVCGKALGSHKVFVIGPMCVVNRTTSEPPSHRACAEYSASYCPHLIHPQAKRRTETLPDDHLNPGGQMILENPGVTVLWESNNFSYYTVPNGTLIDIGDPVAVEWWTEGHRASRDEVVPKFRDSLERLKHLTAEHYADDPGERDAAFLQLGKQAYDAMRYLPPGM
jgi:hypothetical protein